MTQRRSPLNAIRESGALVLMLLILLGASCVNEPDRNRVIEPSRPASRALTDTPAPNSTATSGATVPPPSRTPTRIATPENAIPTDVPTASPSPDLTFLSSDGNMLVVGSKLWLVPERQRVVDLSIDVGVANQPWSPDGRLLVGWDRKNQELAVFDIGEQTLSPVRDSSASYSAPFWSPNGNYLLYSVPGGSPVTSTVVVYDFGAESETILAEEVELLSLSGWSYDSQEVGFVYRYREGEDLATALEIVDLGSANHTTISLPSTNIEAASWSPTTKELLLYATPGEPSYNPELPVYLHWELYLLNTSTGTVIPIPGGDDGDEHSYYIHNMPWTQDGDRIIYSDTGIICMFDLNSGMENCPQQIQSAIEASGAADGRYPSWSNDNKWIGFVLHFQSEQCSPLAVIRPDGSDLIFTDSQAGACSVFGPVWSTNTVETE